MATPPPPSPHNKPLGFDEFIAVLVAFTTIGIIFLVSIGRRTSEPIASNLPVAPAFLGPWASTEPIAVAPASSQPTVTPAKPTTTPQPSAVPSQPPLSIPSPPAVIPIPLIGDTASPQPTASPTVKFSDVPSDYWAAPFVEALSARQIIAGFRDGKFGPDQPMTRAQFAAILPKVIERSANLNSIKFKDVQSDYWAAAFIDKTVKMGYLKGYPGNIFRPNEPVSRVQVLAALTNGLNLKATTSPTKTLAIFKDAKQVPSWATNQVTAATEAGLVVNYPKREMLNPTKPATRAEVAAMVYQALVKEGQAEAKPSDYIVRP